MTEELRLQVLSSAQVHSLDRLAAGVVDLRRDIYQFVSYVEDKGLVRTKRDNAIPKAAARRLAKLLSYAGEADAVERDNHGYWSDYVSQVARKMGFITFDTEGEYLGYSSTAPSFPDNAIGVQKKAWRAYLGKTPLQKERALLDACLRLTPNEFFTAATLIEGDRFDNFGSATGPADAMKLPHIRRELMKFLAALEPGCWYEMRSAVELLQAGQPNLILDPSTRSPDYESGSRLQKWEWNRRFGKTKSKKSAKPEIQLEDIYTNFREQGPGEQRWDHRTERQITSRTAEAFHRVEGRYLEYFLSEIPYLFGFVELAYRPSSDRHGLDVSPTFERLQAFRLTPRFSQIMRHDVGFDRVKVTVLPTFEVLVEASSYPEVTLETLAPYTTEIGEDGPIYRLRLEQRKVVEAAAQNPGGPSAAQVVEKLSKTPLPENVAAECSGWSGRGEKVIVYEGFGLLEFCAEKLRKPVLDDMGALLVDNRLEGFAVVREPDRAFSRLEERLHVPIRIKHRDGSFIPYPGRLGAASAEEQPRKVERRPKAKATKVQLTAEDLVGYHASDASLLPVLQKMLEGQAKTCVITGGDLLVLSAADLPRLRAALRKVSDRFEVTIDGHED
jgi:hypothetical protein